MGCSGLNGPGGLGTTRVSGGLFRRWCGRCVGRYTIPGRHRAAHRAVFHPFGDEGLELGFGHVAIAIGIKISEGRRATRTPRTFDTVGPGTTVTFRATRSPELTATAIGRGTLTETLFATTAGRRTFAEALFPTLPGWGTLAEAFFATTMSPGPLGTTLSTLAGRSIGTAKFSATRTTASGFAGGFVGLFTYRFFWGVRVLGDSYAAGTQQAEGKGAAGDGCGLPAKGFLRMLFDVHGLYLHVVAPVLAFLVFLRGAFSGAFPASALGLPVL